MTSEAFERVAAEAPWQGASGGSQAPSGWIEAFLAHFSIQTRGPLNYKDGRKWQLEACPFNPAHAEKDACIYELPGGAVTFKCSHNSCADKTWQHFRQVYDPDKSWRFVNENARRPDLKRLAMVHTEPEWPNQPDEAVFYGLPGDFVRAILPHTEADPVALLVHFLAAFGVAVGPGPHFMVGATRHPARTNVVIVGKSSKARKGDSLTPTLAVFNSISDRPRQMSGLASGEGLISAVRDAVEKEVRDKKTGELSIEVVDEGIADKRLLVVEPELARTLTVLKRVGNTLSAVVRDSWDYRDLNIMTKSSMTASTPHIAIAGHITVTELRRELDDTTAANGFANRFIWFAVRRSKHLPRPAPVPKEALGHLSRAVEEAIHEASSFDELDFDVTANDVWHGLYEELSDERDGLAGSLLARAEAQVLRLAMIYALCDGTPAINEHHLLAAVALWEYSVASVYHIFGEALGNPVSDTILSALKSAGEMSRTDISTLFGRNVRAEVISVALQQLQEAGRATFMTVPTSGRPLEVWRAL